MDQRLTQRTDVNRRLEIQSLGQDALRAYQLNRLNQLLGCILPENRFYADKFGLGVSLEAWEDLAGLPFTTKQELNAACLPAGDSNATVANYARNLTLPLDHYSRFHRTSGTRGTPMIVLDTAADWQWWMEAWQQVLDAAQLTAADRVVMAFSFGPFIGFWSAFDAAVERGAMVAPTGAMSTVARLELICSVKATVVFCTPSYALRLIEVAAAERIDLVRSAVRAIVVAGEPGGSVPAIRQRIETGFAAKVVDHSGASEVGPWGFPDAAGQGIYVNEAQFIPEFISIETGQPAGDGELSELVLTTLGRAGCPVIRYRTGDLVRPSWQASRRPNATNRFVLLVGGVLGRTDDMLIIRGVNVFPSAIEAILREFPEVIEYRMIASREAAMDQLEIEVEDTLDQPARIARALQTRLGLRVNVHSVAAGSLPRFELKGNRFVDRRTDPPTAG